MTNYVARVRGAARTVAVPNGARREVTRPSRPGDDHSARIRIAQTLGLEVPRSLRSSRTRQPSTADPSVPGPCARLLAAAGPLRMTTLVSAIERSRRFRDRAIGTDYLAQQLAEFGVASLGPDDLWVAVPSFFAPERYRKIVELSAGREFAASDDCRPTAGRLFRQLGQWAHEPFEPAVRADRTRQVPGHWRTYDVAISSRHVHAVGFAVYLEPLASIRRCRPSGSVAIQLGARAGGSHGPVVNSSVSASSLSLRHLVAVEM